MRKFRSIRSGGRGADGSAAVMDASHNARLDNRRLRQAFVHPRSVSTARMGATEELIAMFGDEPADHVCGG